MAATDNICIEISNRNIRTGMNEVRAETRAEAPEETTE